MTDRKTLEADLIGYQKNGNWAAQAETLMVLGRIANQEDEYILAHGLYGQAWAAYEQIGDKSGDVKALWSIANAMANHILFCRFERLPQIFNWFEIHRLNEWAMAQCDSIPDLRIRADTYRFINITDSSRRTGFSKIALQRALHCYELLNDGVEQVQVLIALSNSTSVASPEYGQYSERLLSLYRRLEDLPGEAHTLYALGYHKKWMGDGTTANEFWKSAQHHFGQIQDYRYMVKCILEINILTLKQLGYEAYREHQLESIAQVYQMPPARAYLLPLWRSLATIARQNKDLDTARLAFQQAITCAVSAGQAKKQGDLYWQWGFMEYHDAERHSMGFALCRWAFTLIRLSDPQSTEHQRQFKSLCREMKRGLRKRRD